MGELTWAPTVANWIPFSKALSIDLLISGVYPFIHPSSSLSDERRDSAYAVIVSSQRWVVVKSRTVAFAENRNSRDTWFFPTTTTSARFCQTWADWSVIRTNSVQWIHVCWSPNRLRKGLVGQYLRSLVGSSPTSGDRWSFGRPRAFRMS